jgi:hypothetical protein
MARTKAEIQQEADAFEAERARCLFWENTAKKHIKREDSYRDELEKAHAVIGRLIMQAGDEVHLSKYLKGEFNE